MTGVACGLQNRYGAFVRPGWVRFPPVPAMLPGGRGAARRAALVLLAMAPGAVLRAQEPVPAGPGAVVADSAAAPADTVPPVTPLGALVRSMVVPGWGQAEVGRPARGAIYFAAEAATLFMVFKSQAKLEAARRADPPDQALIDSRTGQRENWIVLSVFVAFISGLDAWVSTHMWDFEPTIRAPDDGSVGVAAGFRVRVP